MWYFHLLKHPTVLKHPNSTEFESGTLIVPSATVLEHKDC